MNWKPHTQQPDRFPLPCLIASPDGEGGYYLQDDIYNWDGKQFRQEISGHPIYPHDFFWIPESEVLQGLPAYPQGACPSGARCCASTLTP